MGFGGCWCTWFHSRVGRPEGEKGRPWKERLVREGNAHAALVFDGDVAVAWCQYGSPAELPNIKNPKAYEKELDDVPDWRIGCLFTGKDHRGQGVARAAVAGALEAIEQAGGGLVEAYPEQVEGRKPQRGAYFHTGPEDLFVELGFERERRIAKWRWVMRRRVPS